MRTFASMSNRVDKRKQSLYFPEKILAEMQAEAARQDRSLSWIVQRAWVLARAEVAKQPTVDPVTPMDAAVAGEAA